MNGEYLSPGSYGFTERPCHNDENYTATERGNNTRGWKLGGCLT